MLFNVSHTVEHVLTDKAQGSLATLFDQIPQQAALVELNESGSPNIADTRLIPTAQVEVGSNVLVRPGQQVCYTDIHCIQQTGPTTQTKGKH